MVRGELEDSFVSKLSAGTEFMLALTLKGKVYAWGDGVRGQLGYGEDVGDEPQCVPRAVTGDLDGQRVVEVACGKEHAAAVTHAGEIFTWGAGEHGQLGHGDEESRIAPTVVVELGRLGEDQKVCMVACGAVHTVALTEERMLYSFGLGFGGRLGFGPHRVGNEAFPKVVTALAQKPLSCIYAGADSTFALTCPCPADDLALR